MKNIKIKTLFLVLYLILTIYIIHPDPADDKIISDNSTDINNEDYINFDKEDKGLTIIGTQETSQDIKTITKEDIEKINPSDFIELLERKENLPITKYGSYGTESTIGLRGFGKNQIAILIDGIPVNSEQSGYFDLSKINLANIEKIEIIKGGSDTKYNVSGAIGGVINIITKKQNKAGYKIYSSVSNLFYYPDFYYPKGKYKKEDKLFSKWYDFFDTQHGTFGFGIGNQYVYWNTDWSGTRAFNHFIYKDENNIKRRRVNNEVYDSSIASYLTINLPNYMKLILSGDHYYGYKFIPGPINWATPGKQIDNMAKGSLFFDADYVGSEKIDTEIILSNNFTNKDWYENINKESDKPTSYHALNTLKAINRWGFFLTDWLTIRIGGDFSYTHLNSTDIKTINSFNGGGWVTFEYSIKNIAQIIPSVKLIYYKKYPIAVPKLGLVFYIGENFTLKNNFFRVYNLPSLDALYWPKQAGFEGNPDLQNEDGVGGDVILSYYKKNILFAETSFYITYLNDAISWQAGKGGKYMPENIGRALYIGSDNTIKSDFSDYVKLTINYSFLLSYYLGGNVKIDDDKRMPYTPVHNLGIGAEFNWKSGQINLLAKYSSERFTTPSNVTQLLSYFTLDINFSQKIKIFTLFASVKNALNYFYYLVDGYPMPGGSVVFGIKINYVGEFNKKSHLKD